MKGINTIVVNPVSQRPFYAFKEKKVIKPIKLSEILSFSEAPKCIKVSRY